MLKRASLLFAAVLCLLLAHQARAVWEYVQGDFSASYAIYGAYLDDPVPAVAGDAKVAFRLTGTAAKDMFEAIGPDLRDGCPTHKYACATATCCCAAIAPGMAIAVSSVSICRPDSVSVARWLVRCASSKHFYSLRAPQKRPKT